MSRLQCVGMVLILLLAASCTSRSGGSISEKGNTIELKTEQHVVKAVKGTVQEGAYVLMSARSVDQPESLTYLDGRLSLLSQGDFDRFMKMQNRPDEMSREDFMKMRKSLKRVSVIAENGPIQAKIKRLSGEQSKNAHPLIEISMTELQVVELKHLDKPIFLSGDVGKHYLVSKLKVLRDDYAPQ